jgi:hypothetical protein
VRYASLVVVACAACAKSTAIAPTAPQPLPRTSVVAVDTTPKERRRMIPPEVYLRAYLGWFGGLAPLDVQNRAKPRNLFDQWDDYLAALGLPDYRIDLPRATQSNTLMLATLGRLGEALCIRAAERDLHGKPPPLAERVVFAFDAKPAPSRAEFAERFDVLHRTFLGYPSALAPEDRVGKFYALYQTIARRHVAAAKKNAPLTPDETAWAATCIALVQHPEAELY